MISGAVYVSFREPFGIPMTWQQHPACNGVQRKSIRILLQETITRVCPGSSNSWNMGRHCWAKTWG